MPEDSKEPNKPDSSIKNEEQLFIGADAGCIGANLVLIQGMLGLQPDTLITAAIIIIAIAIVSVTLHALVILLSVVNAIRYEKLQGIHSFVAAIGWGGTAIAIGIAIWHISWVAGIIYAIAIGMAFILLRYSY
jgi:hypothetical protein